MTQILRTPEDRFADLPGYPFSLHFAEDLPGFQGLRLHYVDEGPKDGESVFLCLHGQPTWSYLYRRMIPVFTAAGHRSVAPDFFGFGRSDKPVDESVYTVEFHRNTLMAFIKHLGLERITLVCQDWGGILGLTLPMDMPGRFSRLLVMNTALGTGDVGLSAGFLAWREWVNQNPDMAVGSLMARACPHLSTAEFAAYDAPFPNKQYKSGVRRFPNLVPDRPDTPAARLGQRAREWLKTEWSGDTFMAIGMQDPVLGPPVMRALQRVIRGCPEPVEMAEAGHFVQEWGEEVAQQALEAYARAKPKP
jgi:haloalkane dehalogenase/tRNA(adenine34) deaminase